jgi:hypothetical protein
MPVPSDSYPTGDQDLPDFGDDTADYAGLSFSAAGGTSWPARIVRRLNAITAALGLDSDTATSVYGRLDAVEGAVLPAWQDFTPHIYYESSTGVYTEITYGTSPVRDGWYMDDGRTVDFVMQVRLPTDADLGPDGKGLCIGLPATADTSLGNTFAVILNAQVTFGIKAFNHNAGVSIHAGRPNDLANGDFAYFVRTGTLYVTNTDDSITSDGNATTGWHDFHVAGRYRRA